MTIHEQNKKLFSLPSDHPARRFLAAFIDCRKFCVGREIGISDSPAIEQTWYSQVEKKQYAFSSFAYKYLSFDVVLDGWLCGVTEMTESERKILEDLPKAKSLLAECHAAALNEQNIAIFPLLAKVSHLFDLWEQCITARQANNK